MYKKPLIELRFYIDYLTKKSELLANGAFWSQPADASAPFVEYKGLSALSNPEAPSYKPLPGTLTEEGDFRVVRYPIDNPLQHDYANDSVLN